MNTDPSVMPAAFMAVTAESYSEPNATGSGVLNQKSDMTTKAL